MKKIGTFTWILPGLYVITVVLIILGDVIGAGYVPKWIRDAFFVASAPCYVISFAWPKFLYNAVVNLILCLVINLIAYTAAGYLIDAMVRRYKHRRGN